MTNLVHESRRESTRQFLTFAIIGVIGFLVDSSALLIGIRLLGLGLYVGRVFSFFIAATATWALNRQFTFAPDVSRSLPMQWLRFVGANAIGGAANYAIYATLVTFVPFVAAWPVVGVAAGALVGLAFNFTVSKFWVFRARSL